MTAQATFSLDAIDAALAAAGPGLDPDEQRLAAAVLRLMAAGEPVGVPAAAAAAGMPASRAGQLLRSWPGVFWDDPGQVTGFWGPGPGAHAAPHPPRRHRSACLVRL